MNKAQTILKRNIRTAFLKIKGAAATKQLTVQSTELVKIGIKRIDRLFKLTMLTSFNTIKLLEVAKVKAERRDIRNIVLEEKPSKKDKDQVHSISSANLKTKKDSQKTQTLKQSIVKTLLSS